MKSQNGWFLLSALVSSFSSFCFHVKFSIENVSGVGTAILHPARAKVLMGR